MAKQDIILYESGDGNIKVSLFARDGSVWLNQLQLAELFATSKQSISSTINNILKDNELDANSVIKDYLTTASDGKNYKVKFYSLEMIMAVGFRVRSTRGVQFRQWANQHLWARACHPICHTHSQIFRQQHKGGHACNDSQGGHHICTRQCRHNAGDIPGCGAEPLPHLRI
ncbi:MAG: virulence RhuM family protein [Bacteroidaceae bacterium]|nr:virulence RhuM family protein [Bacteroidaceae bacterium]